MDKVIKSLNYNMKTYKFIKDNLKVVNSLLELILDNYLTDDSGHYRKNYMNYINRYTNGKFINLNVIKESVENTLKYRRDFKASFLIIPNSEISYNHNIESYTIDSYIAPLDSKRHLLEKSGYPLYNHNIKVNIEDIAFRGLILKPHLLGFFTVIEHRGL